MIRISGLYYRYIFSGKMILIYCLLMGIYTTSILYSSGLFDGYYFIDMYREEYLTIFTDEFVVITKLVSVIFSILLVVLLNRESCLDMAKYIIDKPIKRFHLVLGRLFIVVFVSLITVSLFFLIFLIVNDFLTPYDFDKNNFIVLYLGISLQVVTYSSITFLVMSLIPNLFISFIPIVLFWYMEVNLSIELIEADELIKIIYDYIPNLIKVQGNYSLTHNYLNYILTIIILLLSSVFLNIKKDIK